MPINIPTTRTAAAIALVLGTFVSAPASAIPIVIDITGVEVDSVTTLTEMVVTDGTITEIEFDFDVEHFGISWGSEMGIEVTAPDSTSFSFDGASEFGFSNSSGLFSFAGAFPIAATDALGTWTFNFTDSFQDGVSPDHRYNAGSSITLNGMSVSAVPISGTLTLLVGGLAAWGFSRRREKVV